MQTINMLEASAALPRLVAAIEQGHEQEIVIARNGRPVARLVPLAPFTYTYPPPAKRRLGIAKGLFVVPDNIDVHNGEIAAMFAGSGV